MVISRACTLLATFVITYSVVQGGKLGDWGFLLNLAPALLVILMVYHDSKLSGRELGESVVFVNFFYMGYIYIGKYRTSDI